MTAPACAPEPLTARLVVLDEEPLAAADMAALLRSLGHPRVTEIELDRKTALPGLLDSLRNEHPDLLLLELGNGDGPALDLLEALQHDRLLRRVPVFATQAEDLAAERLRALQLHAVEVLPKPLDPAEFALRLRNQLQRKLQQDQLSFTDGATGLPNREWALRRLDDAVKEARRYGSHAAVLQVGLDRFRQIHDALGLTLGDELLREVGLRLQACVRDTDLVSHTAPQAPMAQVARSDGDAFTALLPRLGRADQASAVAQRIVAALQPPLQVAGHEVFVTCRIGIAVFPGDGQDKDSLLERAILAMRHGQADPQLAATGPVRFYSQALHGRFTHRLAMERELHHALERHELQLLYQPKVGSADGRLLGAEALMRWQHPQRGRLGPDAFIALAEETGLILPLGEWALREAIRQMAAWDQQGLPLPLVAVNVSSHQLRRPGLADTVRHDLQEAGLDGSRLCLELTESAILDNSPQVMETLRSLKQLGVQLALDDFGTGYSSLSGLRSFPLDELKVDRSFITECENPGSSAAIITRAIIAMAHGLGLRVVAEGIETEGQLHFLRANGCDQYQGFLFSRPLLATDMVKMLRRCSSARVAA